MVPNTKMNAAPASVKMGQGLIDILTAGMYNKPLMVLREYVQNAVDAIDEAVEEGRLPSGAGVVNITLDGRDRTLTVEDNGVGIGNDDVPRVLCSLGCSGKREGRHRGFRGIGRLGGVGYCDMVVFETRSSAKEHIAVVEWDCRQLRSVLATPDVTLDAQKAIRKVVRISFRRPFRNERDHLFRVVMHGVHRFHKDELMNVSMVTSYLSQVAPVAFDNALFPFVEEIEQHLSDVDCYACYDIRLNGQKLHRPHTQAFEVSAKQSDTIQGVELFDIQGQSGARVGRGWYAKTRYLASVPPRVGMRGIRIRQGNIEVGNEYALEDAYAERRFSTWHIGEIHVDYSLRPNARRDGFEQSADYQAFLEQISLLGRHLSQLCRISSKNRSAEQAGERMVQRLEILLERPFFVDESHFRQDNAEAKRIVRQIEEYQLRGELSRELMERLASAKEMLANSKGRPLFLRDALDGRSLRHLEKKELLEEVARAILDSHDGLEHSHGLVTRVLSGFLKQRVTERIDPVRG